MWILSQEFKILVQMTSNTLEVLFITSVILVGAPAISCKCPCAAC